MSLNPDFSSAAAVAPDAKFSLNINAFNGNTTNFNRCAAPKPKAMLTTVPVQPRDGPIPSFGSTVRRPGMMMPM
jgi:hypothetical protein